MTAQLTRRFLVTLLAFALSVPLLAACADPWPDRPETYQDQVNDNDLSAVAMFLRDPAAAAEYNQARLDALLTVQDKALSHEAQLAAAQAQLDLVLAREKRAGLQVIGLALIIAITVYLCVFALLANLPRILAARKPAPVYVIEAEQRPAPSAQATDAQLPARVVTPGMAEFAVVLAAVGGWRGSDGNYYARQDGEVVRVDYFTEE